MAQVMSNLFSLFSMIVVVIISKSDSAPISPLRGGIFQNGGQHPVPTMSKLHNFFNGSISKEDLIKVSAKFKRGLDSDESSLVEVCGCERLPKLYEAIEKPSWEQIDTPVNCPQEWVRKTDENQIPPVYYEAKCKTSDDCCNTKTGDYNCAPVKRNMLVLVKLNKKSSKGCCLYKPDVKTISTSCACLQKTDGMLAPTVPTERPLQ